MPLLSLLYHCVGDGKHQTPYEILTRHFHFLSKNYPIVLPGEPFSNQKVNLMLSFDDAYFSFYHYIFPLLKELNMRAILAIAPKYIVPSTSSCAIERLAVPFSLRTQEGIFEKFAPFCTWEELEEIVQSGLVQVASHGFVHGNLKFPFMDLHREVVQSKELLEEKLRQPISSFVYPFGKYSPIVHQYVQKHYTYSFRIGGGWNWSWESKKTPLLRVCVDQMHSPFSPFTLSSQSSYFFKSLC